ncbi:hypothetical protein BDF19DRAFT_261297 [Syncephalis fuscata]|nr:hypothetical protein BDF19DRAFT_261297 [Syncephalis fuscata]
MFMVEAWPLIRTFLVLHLPTDSFFTPLLLLLHKPLFGGYCYSCYSCCCYSCCCCYYYYYSIIINISNTVKVNIIIAAVFEYDCLNCLGSLVDD